VDALALEPNNPRALVALGQLREAAGDPAQAAANYSRALAVDPQQPVVAARVASLSTPGSAGVAVATLPPPAGAVPYPAAPPGPVAATPLPPGMPAR
jgi:predicted Zn-dependent protease